MDLKKHYILLYSIKNTFIYELSNRASYVLILLRIIYLSENAGIIILAYCSQWIANEVIAWLEVLLKYNTTVTGEMEFSINI